MPTDRNFYEDLPELREKVGQALVAFREAYERENEIWNVIKHKLGADDFVWEAPKYDAVRKETHRLWSEYMALAQNCAVLEAWALVEAKMVLDLLDHQCSG